jgi:hypothetical protein
MQAGDHFVVGCLREIGVELPDSQERCRGLQAEQLVGADPDPGLPLRRRDGHGEYHPGRSLRAGDLAGGLGGRPGGDAVIDHHRNPAVKRLPRPAAAEAPCAAFELGAFSCLDRGQLVLGDPSEADDLAVDDPPPVLADGSHAQFGLERHPKLADDDDVERRAEAAGHFVGDRDAAARQAKDHDTLISQVLQPGGQAPSRIGPISENHGHLLSRPTLPLPCQRHQGSSSPSATARVRA